MAGSFTILEQVAKVAMRNTARHSTAVIRAVDQVKAREIVPMRNLGAKMPRDMVSTVVTARNQPRRMPSTAQERL